MCFCNLDVCVHQNSILVLVFFSGCPDTANAFPGLSSPSFCKFNVHVTAHCSMFILYNQRDATYTMFFNIISALHVSGGFSAHHQEQIKLYVAALGIAMLSCCLPLVWMGWNPNHTTARRQENMTIPKAAHTVL